MAYLYRTFIFEPMYNGLIFLMDVIPWADAGVAIIIFTLIIKLILFPLSKKSVQTQLKMRKVEPELNAIKEKYKNDRQEQAKKTLEFYRREGINPFSGILLILIQLPIIFALYKVFLSPGLPIIDANILYAFVSVPESVNVVFLGFFDISKKSIILAIIAGITTFFQVRFSMPPVPKKNREPGAKPSFQEDLVRSMNLQMRYAFPVLAFLISWSISGAIALYWITSNLFTIGQELVIRKSLVRAGELNGPNADAKK